jgi:hypothetical protein
VLSTARVLSLFTMRRCTAACDHCAVGGSPQARGALSVPRMHALLDEAARAGGFERVVFTGGECFLLGRHLDELIVHAHALGFITRAISNGYWAASKRSAAERARRARAAGLDELMLSTGTFHQRFVPVARVATAARAAAEAGIETHVSVEDCDQSAFDDTALRDELRRFTDAGTISISNDPWIPDAAGRGSAALSHEGMIAAGRSTAQARCAQILTVLSVTPDGMLTACCGFPMEELPALHIGSVLERPLDDVLARAPNQLLHLWLHVRGPADLAAFVARYVPGFALPALASICQACVALQRDPRAMSALYEHAGTAAAEIAGEFAALHGTAAYGCTTPAA